MQRLSLFCALMMLSLSAHGQSYYFPNQVGATGAEGALGPQGPQGVPGPQGDPGVDGTDGIDSAPILVSVSATAASTIPVTGFVSSTWFKYLVDFQCKVSDDDTQLLLRTRPAGGSVFDNANGSYSYSTIFSSADGTTAIAITDDTTFGVGNSNGDSIAGRLTIETVGDDTTQPLIRWNGGYIDASSHPLVVEGLGARISAQAIDAIEFSPDKGTLTCEIRVTGVRNANVVE
jgi:hypothetical protein